MITFLGCDGQWSAMTNPPSCSGELQVLTAHELVATQQLDAESYQQMKSDAVVLFSVALGFIAIKKIFR